MNPLFKYIILTCLILSVTSIVISFKGEKNGYVIIGTLLDKFNYNKEVQSLLNKTTSARQKILDSLRLDLTSLNYKIKAGEDTINNKRMLDIMNERYMELAAQFERDNQAMEMEYNNKVVAQLNELIVQYGKENGYSIIFGNSSGGSLMYGDNKLNITDDVILYVNQKYSGR